MAAADDPAPCPQGHDDTVRLLPTIAPDLTPPLDFLPPACLWSFMPANFDPCDPLLPSPGPALDLTVAGTYQYDCAVHGQLMTGTVVVVGAAAAPSQPSTDTMPSPPMGY